eukprot:1884385-Karenia_brevis.AAC.1
MDNGSVSRQCSTRTKRAGVSLDVIRFIAAILVCNKREWNELVSSTRSQWICRSPDTISFHEALSTCGKREQ